MYAQRSRKTSGTNMFAVKKQTNKNKTDQYKEQGPGREKAPAFQLFLSADTASGHNHKVINTYWTSTSINASTTSATYIGYIMGSTKKSKSSLILFYIRDFFYYYSHCKNTSQQSVTVLKLYDL